MISPIKQNWYPSDRCSTQCLCYLHLRHHQKFSHNTYKQQSKTINLNKVKKKLRNTNQQPREIMRNHLKYPYHQNRVKLLGKGGNLNMACSVTIGSDLDIYHQRQTKVTKNTIITSKFK